MFARLNKVILIGLLVILVAGCGGNGATPTPIQSLIQPPAGGAAGNGKFKQTDCPFTIPTDAAEAKGVCGLLTVPEDRSKPQGKTIDLPVAVYQSPAKKDAEPLLFLFSNPGPVLQYSWQFHYALTDLHGRYTFVFLEQRGVGYSKPALDCPDVDAMFLQNLDKDPNSSSVVSQSTSLQATCRQKFINDGDNLAGYTTAASAADLDDLRQALGYTQWNIFSIGYGTALATALMRSYPTTVKSVVLEAMLPLDTALFINQATAAETALNQLFKNCSDDKDCGPAYPDLNTTFNAVVDELNAHPIVVETHDLNSGKIFNIWVNGDRLISVVLMALNSGSDDLLPQVPRLLKQVRNKNTDELKAFLAAYVQNSQSNTTGMSQRVYCNEYNASTTVQQVQDADAKASPRIRDYFDRQLQGQADACAVWQADNKIKPAPLPVLKSDIPALILVGDYGWSTPVEWSTQAAKTLTRSTLVVFAGTGQVPNFYNLWTACANSLISTFLDNPGKKLDTACAAVKKSTLWITLP